MTAIEILLNSNEIKRCIVERSFKYGIPLKYICAEVGIQYSKFMASYVNARNPSGVTEEQFDKIFSLLGMQYRINIIVDTSVDMVEKSKALSDKYEASFGKVKR